MARYTPYYWSFLAGANFYYALLSPGNALCWCNALALVFCLWRIAEAD